MIYKVENISAQKYTDALYKKVYDTMPFARKEKADRYHNTKDKRLCVFSYMLLSEMLKEHFGIDSPEFYISEKGKPCLAGNKVHFSISHSGDYVACAVDTSPVGIDIEVPKVISKRVIRHCCNEEEKKYISQSFDSLPDSLPADSGEAQKFLTLWTIKEAYLKYTGEGLSAGLISVETVSNGTISKEINQKQLSTTINKDYVLSVISDNA